MMASRISRNVQHRPDAMGGGSRIGSGGDQRRAGSKLSPPPPRRPAAASAGCVSRARRLALSRWSVAWRRAEEIITGRTGYGPTRRLALITYHGLVYE